jgi:hypothetical protein
MSEHASRVTIQVHIIILGTDHLLQCDDEDLKVLILDIVTRQRVTLIAEECRPLLDTIARQMAPSLGIQWIQIDMSIDEQVKAGIRGKLSNRMQIRFDANRDMYVPPRYAPVEDGIREEFWLDRIQETADDGTVLVICGASHSAPFAEKAEKRGHKVLSRMFHPESLSELKPELF